jgi:Fe-S oxidoreductase
MCKPFGEVSSVTKDEAHSTRVRGMLLWQVATGKRSWDDGISKIVFESSLNTVNEAWCISNYPVPEYILAARADLVEAGLAPAAIKELSFLVEDSFAEALNPIVDTSAEILFYPGDALAAGNPSSASAEINVLSSAGVNVRLPEKLEDTGALAYCLGKIDQATEQANLVYKSLNNANSILVDGPLSFWAITQVFPHLGFELSKDVQIQLLVDKLVSLQHQEKLSIENKAIKAYAVGSEFSRFLEGGYRSFRELLKAVPGLQMIEPVDKLELGHASGASGGLHLTAPDLANAVSRQRVKEALEAGTQWLVCDSPLDSVHIRSVANRDLSTGTLAELILQKSLPTF